MDGRLEVQEHALDRVTTLHHDANLPDELHHVAVRDPVHRLVRTWRGSFALLFHVLRVGKHSNAHAFLELGEREAATPHLRSKRMPARSPGGRWLRP
eukprot:4854629-Prymnesium_polylepis.1